MEELKFLEVKRSILQLKNLRDFASDEAADAESLVKLTEQCLKTKLFLKIESLEVSLLQEMFGALDKFLDENLKRLGFDS